MQEIETLQKSVAEFTQNANNAIQTNASELKELRGQVTSLSDAFTSMAQKRTNGYGLIGTKSRNPVGSLAAELLQADQFRAVARGLNRQFGQDINMKALLGLGTKSVLVTDVDGDTVSQPQRIGLVSSTPSLVRRLRDVIPVGSASSGTVEWVRQTNAKQLAASQFGDGAREAVAKKASDFTMVPTKTPVETIAHYTEASRQVIDDTDGLEAFIRAELLDGIERELERQILEGDGTDGELDGFGSSDNYVALTSANTGDNAVDLIRRALAQLEANGYLPDSIVLNPLDWAAIELVKTEEGVYTAGVPRQVLPASLWGVSVYPSQYVTPGDAIVAALGQTTRLWVREEGRLLVTDSHAENFTSNVLTFLAEMRAAMTVTRKQGVIRFAL